MQMRAPAPAPLTRSVQPQGYWDETPTVNLNTYFLFIRLVQALLWEINTTFIGWEFETVGNALFEGPVTDLPYGPPGGDYAAVTTTLPEPVNLDPSKYGTDCW
jgi:hypothetical protein